MKKMKKKIKISLMLCLLLVLPGYAQKQANNWYFGYKAGLTWNSTRSFTGTGFYGATGNKQLHDLPVDAPGSLINTNEGCFSLSDEKGNLLFYSDGITIWNRNHDIMTNGSGLTGHNSSTQSGIIIPYPGSKTKYIAICIGQYTQATGSPGSSGVGWLSYSVIDMELDGGLGAVIPTEKNIRLTDFIGPIGESISSIRHANGRDFWITAPSRAKNSYMNAWLATPNGIVANAPVISPFTPGTGKAPGDSPTSGYLKFTPDGKFFAWATSSTSQLHIGHFDTKTGKISNSRSFNWSFAYGVEFSNSGKYLYVRTSNTTGGTLSVSDFQSLLANGVTGSNTIYIPRIYAGSLQMGPDGRIYLGMSSSKNMFVIENPEEMNNLRIYQLTRFTSGTCAIGLPTFSATWFAIDKFKSTICLDEEAVYTISSSTGQVKIDFGEGEGKQIVNVPESGEIRHRFKKPGGYLVTVELYGAIDMEPQTAYTTVYSCYLPVNHNLINIK